MPQPRLYPWKRPAGWWLRNPRYLVFQIRELGGVAAAAYGLILLYMLRRFSQGESAYDGFLALMATPGMLVVTGVLFVLVLVHAVTWFMLIGKAQPVQFTKEPIPWQKAFAASLAVWALVSVAVVYLIFGGL